MAHHALDGPAMHPQDKPVILIADDSRVVRVSLKNILKNDCQLIEAEDGQQAWELLLETPHIQLIFSDLSMPRLDGRKLLRKIRGSEINRIRNIPFIVVTGNEADSGTWDELQDMGATEVVNKPFDPASIVSIVSTLVSRQDSESYMLLPEEEAQTEHLPDALDQNDFMQSASKELSFAIRNKNELAIALLRIDQFDQLASHYSETAIEHILLTTAEVIRQHIHPDDTMAYFGNGMFAMLRPASNAIGTRYIGRRIVEDMAAKQFYLGESDDIISVSMGISAPQIKPGIRLRELLLLAEGRLKAAMDLGGNRVIDKGNDTLTPVGLSSDSAPGLAAETHTTSDLHSDSSKSSRLRLDAASDRPTADARKLEEKVMQLQSRLDSLTYENRELQNQLERWRKQSGESEQLRQRVFELESEQQQMQLKLNELATNNSTLQKRADAAEAERQKLLDGEEEKNVTLKQANQFYEQENVQLEGQLEAVSNRAQKAELAYRKSEQLVLSLKDNNKLLRTQLEQTQQLLNEVQRQSAQPAAAVPEPEPVSEPEPDPTAVAIDTDPIFDDDTYIENRSESSLNIDGFPSSKPLTADEAPASVVQLFAEPSPLQPVAEKTVPNKVEKTPKPTPKSSEPKNPFQSIPAYRPERVEEKFKAPRRPLSSFAIASLILVLLLALGGGYSYYYWQQQEVEIAADTTDAKPPAAEPASAASRTAVPSTQAKAEPSKPPAAQTQTSQQTNHNPGVTPRVNTHPPAASPGTQSTTLADEEARLQAELTLRQLAEEEFQQRLQQDKQEEPPQTAPAITESNPVGEAEATASGTAMPAEAAAPPAVEQTADPDISAPSPADAPTPGLTTEQ